MEKKVFDDYINRFNARDATAFEDYIAPNAKVINGTLEISSMQGMKDHYAKILTPLDSNKLNNTTISHSLFFI